MANFDALKAAIDAAIYSNGSQRITGDILNGVLNSMVDAVNEKKQDPLVSGTNIKTINGTPILGSGNIVIEGGGGSDITVDSTLSTTSTNPVQNRVITNALNELEPYVLGFTIEELINSSSSSLTIDEISELVQAVENNRPIHIKSNSVSNGFCVVNSTIDDTDLLILDFTYSESHYLIEVDGISGSGVFSMTTIGGGSIDIDSELSNVSENPVQNKVITSALDGLEPYVLDFSITDLDGYILSSGGAFTITDISGLVQAVTSGKPLHIKYNDDYTGYYLVNGYIDGADVLSLEFDYNGNRYGVEADTVGGGADAFITEIGSSSISIDSELSDTSENPVQNKVITAALNEKQATLVSGTNIKTINGTSILGSGNIKIEGGGSDIAVDSALSTTSTNPVQNKVIKAELDNKVDVVSGKQLSTEDFTTALKTKLEGLSNYDDTEISNALTSLETQINTLVSGDASSAIESFNEIIAFLNGIEDSESLDSIVASIEQQIASKQDVLVSGTSIKTINGESLLGEGNLEVSVDTSTLATKEELTALTNEMIANEEVTAASLNDLDARVSAIAENVSGSAATKEELEAVVATLEAADTANSEAITTVDGKVDALEASVAEIYATKTELQTEVDTLNGTITTLQNEVIANEEVTAASLNEINDRVNQLSANVSGETATKVELQDAVTSLTNTILENEEISASAFNDINDRLQAIITRLEALENV